MVNKQEVDLFQQAVKDVRPLNKDNTSRVVLRKKTRPQVPKTDINHKLPNSDWDEHNFTICKADEDLFFARTGLQHKTIKKLRQGKMPILASLDLHGLTIPQANATLQEFLVKCQQKELHKVLLIHGKGSAIIKSAINTWLRNYPHTLAFCSAKPKDGGPGAIYLLLRTV